jgi:hypothetical protein
MATLVDKIFGRNPEGPPHSNAADPSIRVPVFANEDIYFYTKRIDNSRVVRASDPKQRETCWKLIGSAGLAVVLLIGVLLPSAYGLLAGYQIESLRKEAQRLANEEASLELKEAQ